VFVSRECGTSHGDLEQCGHRVVFAEWVQKPGSGLSLVQCSPRVGFKPALFSENPFLLKP